MSNKTNLQEYNTTLSGIINKVNNLPVANDWTGDVNIVPSGQDTIIPAYSNKELTVKAVSTEEKTVNPGTSVQEVVPGSGKFLSKVTVNPVKTYINRIEITSLPDKLSYTANKDAFNTDGMIITCYYKDGTSRIVDKYIIDPTVGTIFTEGGTRTVTISYTEDDETVTASFSIEIMTVVIVTWAGGTDAEIVSMIEAADNGTINLADYWTVGQERKVNLSAMPAFEAGDMFSGISDAHEAQTVTMVLMHVGGKELTTQTASGRTTCSFIVGIKNCLITEGRFNDISNDGWHALKRRTWCNSTFYNAIPSTLRPIFKQCKNITGKMADRDYSDQAVTVNDWFALPAEKEVFGENTYADSTAESSLVQFTWYKTAANRKKKLGDTGTVGYWWTRSITADPGANACLVDDTGAIDYGGTHGELGLSLFGVI